MLVAIESPAEAEPADVRVVLSMLPEMTGQPGAGVVPVDGGVSLTLADPGTRGDAGSTLIGVDHSVAPDPSVRGAVTRTAFTVTDVEAGERVIVRVDTRVDCAEGARPTGVLQVAVESAAAGATVIPVGRQTIPVKVDASTTTTTTTTTTKPPTDRISTPKGELEPSDTPRSSTPPTSIASCSNGQAANVAGTPTNSSAPSGSCRAKLPLEVEPARLSLASTGSQGPTVLAGVGVMLAFLGFGAVRSARRHAR